MSKLSDIHYILNTQGKFQLENNLEQYEENTHFSSLMLDTLLGVL